MQSTTRCLQHSETSFCSWLLAGESLQVKTIRHLKQSIYCVPTNQSNTLRHHHQSMPLSSCRSSSNSDAHSNISVRSKHWQQHLSLYYSSCSSRHNSSCRDSTGIVTAQAFPWATAVALARRTSRNEYYWYSTAPSSLHLCILPQSCHTIRASD